MCASIRAVTATRPDFPEPYVDLEVGGRRLDQLVADWFGDPSLVGLVPCLLPWYDGPHRERELQISRTPARVCWTRLGFSLAGNLELPEGVANRVKWAERPIHWEFALDEYQAVFDAFGALPV